MSFKAVKEILILQCFFHFQSVALDPEFSKKRTKMYVTGGTKVLLKHSDKFEYSRFEP